jgi:hypothetical protein
MGKEHPAYPDDHGHEMQEDKNTDHDFSSAGDMGANVGRRRDTILRGRKLKFRIGGTS